MRRAIEKGLLPSAVLVALGVGGGPAAGPAAGAAVAVAILWAPVGTVLGYLGAKWSESSWEPCRQTLQESLRRFDPMAVLATKLKAALNREGVQSLEIGTAGADAGDEALASDFKSILNVQIQRVVLHFCSTSSLSNTLCLDVVTRARLFEAATKTYRYDNVLVYSKNAELSTLELRPYELFVTDPETDDTSSSIRTSLGRELEAYCGEGGGELLQGDLSRALDAIVNRIVQDLGLRVE
jgi:hypothetical protein